MYNDYDGAFYLEFTPNKWFNVIETYDGQKITYYINGEYIGEIYYYLNLNYNTYAIAIGADNNSSSNMPNTEGGICGGFANYRIYNRVLTNDEIQILANELKPIYLLNISEHQDFNFYQKNEGQYISYNVLDSTDLNFEIINGELPNSISFNNQEGYFYGKGLTDSDHVYDLTIKITGKYFNEKIIYVTINTYKTARISFNNQSFNFITESSSTNTLSKTSDETVTFSIESGTLPNGITFNTNTGKFTSTGQQTSNETKSVVIRAISPNNQTGVTATITLNVTLNTITFENQTVKFYTLDGATLIGLKYTSVKTITPVYSIINGSLPNGITFNTNTGEFSCDVTQSSDSTTSLIVQIESSSGYSQITTATVNLIIDTVNESPKSLIIDIGVDTSCTITLSNNTFIPNPRTGGAVGNHYGIRSSAPWTYFGYPACLIGQDENNLSEWKWTNNYIIPFSVNNIDSIELISCPRNLSKVGNNKYQNSNCTLKLENNVISIIDNAGSSAEYKFKVNFN